MLAFSRAVYCVFHILPFIIYTIIEMYDYALSIYQKKMCKVAKNSVRFDKIQGVLSLITQ